MIKYNSQGGGLRKDGGGAAAGAWMRLKKGPWTAAEDQVLAAYVRKYGEGNWNAVGKNTGLARCGKSCRLRWANHLSPNLKKGSFSPEEERLIIRLHSQLGNKWSRIASQLPGRTDNEIKNYWNTRLKKIQRQGLPLYPPDIISTNPIQHKHLKTYFPHPPCSSSSSTTTTATKAVVAAYYPSSFTFQATAQLNPQSPSPCPSPTTPPHPPSPISSTLPLFAVPNSSTTTAAKTEGNLNNSNVFGFSGPSPILKQPFCAKRFGDNSKGSNFIAPSASSSTTNSNGFLSSFLPPANYSYSSLLTLPNSSYNASSPNSWNSSSFVDTSSSSLFQTQFSCSVSSNYSVYLEKQDFPSNQNSQPNGMESFGTAVTRGNSQPNNFSNNENQKNSGIPESNCRLLEEMLEATEGMVGNRGTKRKQVLEQPEENNMTRQKPNEEVSLWLNAVEEDMAKLFDSMPATMREWFSEDGALSNKQLPVLSDDNLMPDLQNLASLFPIE